MTSVMKGTPRWLATAGETGIFLASVTFLLTASDRALAAWLAIGTLYLIAGSAAVWNGRPVHAGDVATARTVVRWSWIPPVLAAAVGAASAVTALQARNSNPGTAGNQSLVVAASLGVILSWVLLQVGFAQIYLVVDAVAEEEENLRFPTKRAPSMLDYLYFSFTLGTSFATSDVEIISLRMRRLVLIHTVLAFFYNALVVAVAFQVLQGTASA